jgi:hypothetical protein
VQTDANGEGLPVRDTRRCDSKRKAGSRVFGLKGKRPGT